MHEQNITQKYSKNKSNGAWYPSSSEACQDLTRCRVPSTCDRRTPCTQRKSQILGNKGKIAAIRHLTPKPAVVTTPNPCQHWVQTIEVNGKPAYPPAGDKDRLNKENKVGRCFESICPQGNHRMCNKPLRELRPQVMAFGVPNIMWRELQTRLQMPVRSKKMKLKLTALLLYGTLADVCKP